MFYAISAFVLIILGWVVFEVLYKFDGKSQALSISLTSLLVTVLFGIMCSMVMFIVFMMNPSNIPKHLKQSVGINESVLVDIPQLDVFNEKVKT